MKRQTVTLCVIARDEEATIGTTIKSVLALVDEVVVVDTGSSDNTRIIAEGYGARVVDLAWNDDFAEARNVALDEAGSDWVLILDADEYLQSIRPVEFQRLLHDPAAAGYRLRMISADAADVAALESRVRLFRNDPGVRYTYPIFERIVPALQGWADEHGQIILDTELAVVHAGADLDRRARRRERNVRILRRAVAEHPDEPYFHYQLGCEGVVFVDDEVAPVAGTTSALARLETAWEKIGQLDRAAQRSLPWAVDLGARITSAQLALDRVDEARETGEALRAMFPRHPLVLLLSVAVRTRMLADDREQWAAVSAAGLRDRCRDDLQDIAEGRTENYGTAVDSRVRHLYPLRYQGDLALLEGRVAEAVDVFEKALDLDPSYSFGWLGMAECSRFAGDRKRALKLYLRTVTEDAGNHRAWLLGCGLMREMGIEDNADSWWATLAGRFPEHPAVRRTTGDRRPPTPVAT